MADMFIDKTSAALAKVLDGTSARQRALAENIANVDTPGFTRKEVDFEGRLREVMNRPDPDACIDAIERIVPDTHEDAEAARRADGNNVNVEREMASMAKNSLQYEASAQLLSMKLRALQTAVHEGRR